MFACHGCEFEDRVMTKDACPPGSIGYCQEFYERMKANIQYPTLKSNDQGDCILLPGRAVTNIETWTFLVRMRDWIDQAGRLSVTE
jgi:hypothetical protein